MKLSFLRLLVFSALVATTGTPTRAEIPALDLTKMVAISDGAIHGEIVARQVFRVDHPIDGPELYFTRLTLQGQSLLDGQAQTIDLVFHGGFLDETRGVFNSSAPCAQDTEIGRRVVAFYCWNESMGGGVVGNALVAAKGGLFRTVEGPHASVVLGRGLGYAIRANQSVSSLRSALRQLFQAKSSIQQEKRS